jgi:hypothetical protein
MEVRVQHEQDVVVDAPEVAGMAFGVLVQHVGLRLR